MTVQELSKLHRAYIDLSDRFKAAWTFHQFVEGIRKVFPGAELSAGDLKFQPIYEDLKKNWK